MSADRDAVSATGSTRLPAPVGDESSGRVTDWETVDFGGAGASTAGGGGTDPSAYSFRQSRSGLLQPTRLADARQ